MLPWVGGGGGGCASAGSVLHETIEDIPVPAEARLVDTLKNVTSAILSLREEQRSVSAALADLARSQRTELETVETAEEPETRFVEVGVLVRRIFNVDTVKQTFSVSLTVQMVWEMPPNEEGPMVWEDDGEWVPKWRPPYRIKRMIDNIMEMHHYYAFIRDNKKYVRAEYEHIVTIFEELELKSFPVDCQDLLILLESMLPTEKVIWRPLRNPDGKTVMMNDTRFSLSDFSMVTAPGLPGFTWRMATFNQEHHERSSMRILVKVQRKYAYYFTNVICIVFGICSLCLCAWGNHPADVGDRQDVDYSLILTAIAFKLVLTSMLPTVSYMTLLDWYVVGGFLFVVGVTICHSILPFCLGVSFLDNSPLTQPPDDFPEERDLIDVDTWVLQVAGVVWVAWNIVYGLTFHFIRSWNYRYFVKTALDQQKEWDKENNWALLHHVPSGAPNSSGLPNTN